MAEFVSTQAPNVAQVTATPPDTSWRVIASDGTTYTTLAALLAAGKTPYPGLDPGAYLQSLSIVSVAGGAPGSAFSFRKNPLTTPTTGQLVPAGVTWVMSGKVETIWVSTNGTDSLNLHGAY